MVSRMWLYPSQIKFIIVKMFNHKVFNIVNSGNNVAITDTVFNISWVPGINAIKVGIIKLKLKTWKKTYVNFYLGLIFIKNVFTLGNEWFVVKTCKKSNTSDRQHCNITLRHSKYKKSRICSCVKRFIIP